MLIAHVALPVPIHQLFDYQLVVPAEIGMRVRVPFGKRQAIGIIVKIDQQSDLNINNLKSIIDVVDQIPLFTDSIWKLLNWAAS